MEMEMVGREKEIPKPNNRVENKKATLVHVTWSERCWAPCAPHHGLQVLASSWFIDYSTCPPIAFHPRPTDGEPPFTMWICRSTVVLSVELLLKVAHPFTL
jgi:hypothetical protein